MEENKQDFLISLAYYQSLFGLENWQIEVLWETKFTEDASAKTLADPKYLKAYMWLSDHIKQTSKKWDEIIIHELIHVVMAWYDYYADNLAQEGTQELFFNVREHSVSQLTTIIQRIIKEKKKN